MLRSLWLSSISTIKAAFIKSFAFGSKSCNIKSKYFDNVIDNIVAYWKHNLYTDLLVLQVLIHQLVHIRQLILIHQKVHIRQQVMMGIIENTSCKPCKDVVNIKKEPLTFPSSSTDIDMNIIDLDENDDVSWK